MRQVIRTLQIEDLKMEELPEENLRLLEERNKTLLTPSMTMHQ